MFGPLVEQFPALRQAPQMTQEAIAAFWEAWPAVRGRVEQELTDRSYGEGTEELTDLTKAIDLALEWDLVPGHGAAYALCLSSAADPGLRSLTERWQRAGPAADMTWEYHPARIAVEPATVIVDEIGIHPRDVTVVIKPDPSTEELDLTVGHPDFGRMDETLQLQVVFRLLDDLLGEDGVEFWVGSIDVVPHPLPWGIPFLDLAQEVDRQVAEATGQHWEMLYADDLELGESQLFINRALKRLRFLDLVEIVMVSIETSGSEDPLVRRVEKDLAATLRSAGVIFAHRIFDTFTVIYAYADPVIGDAISELAGRWRPAVYEVVVEPDPGWETYDDML